VTWPRDDAKLDRVRALMADEGLDALVVRAPDNVLYLTNFWSMKGYDACVFPREGDPVLICLEASAEDAARSAWTPDVRYVRGYDESDPRPVPARTLEAALSTASGQVGLELSLGTQASDRMVGEPTTFTRAWFDAWPDAADAAPLLARARMLKTEQEIARLRIANEIAAPSDRAGHARVGGRGDLAGLRARAGHGPRRRGACARVLARLGRPGHQDLHGHL
jgi:Xaa-Pro dipeptidase